MTQQIQEDSSLNFSAAQTGSLFSISQAAATDEMLQGMNLFQEAAKRLQNVDVPQKQGNLFEFIEAAKFNVDAASKGASVRAHVTAAEGLPHASADVILKEGNQIVDQAQLKSYLKHSELTFKISDPKYEGMQKVVPSDKVDRVRELAETRSATDTLKAKDYRDTAENITGELKHQDIQSGGTTYKENLEAAENPEWYTFKANAQAVGKEVAVTAANAAIAGGIIGGAISTIKNSIAIHKGEITVEDAIMNVGQDVITSGGRSGATGAVSVGIRHAAGAMGIQGLTKSNIATALAAGLIDTGVTILSLAKGEITAEEAMQRVGHTGASTIGGIYGGLAVAATFGVGAPALVGSLAGYMIVSSIYQSCVAIFNNAKLAKKEAVRVIALCEEACRQMQQQRQEFEILLNQAIEFRREQFADCFAAIDAGLDVDDPEATTFALANFAALLGKNIQFQSFDEFDEFMKDEDSVLIL